LPIWHQVSTVTGAPVDEEKDQDSRSSTPKASLKVEKNDLDDNEDGDYLSNYYATLLAQKSQAIEKDTKQSTEDDSEEDEEFLSVSPADFNSLSTGTCSTHNRSQGNVSAMNESKRKLSGFDAEDSHKKQKVSTAVSPSSYGVGSAAVEGKVSDDDKDDDDEDEDLFEEVDMSQAQNSPESSASQNITENLDQEANYVSVAGNLIPYDQVTEDDQEKMTEEEYEKYFDVWKAKIAI